MVKIISYIKKDNEFTRNGGKDGNNKKIVIRAEEEIEQYLNDGWEMISSNATSYVAGAFTGVTTFTELVVIFRKND